MLEFPEVPILIEGHTDSDGGEESNLELSRKRAEAVVNYLVDNGADPARFEVRGHGESQPIADNETAEGKAQNRRIVFTALAE
jgi:outer membrane protein OmpA-like peptidoglycan-associated protein